MPGPISPTIPVFTAALPDASHAFTLYRRNSRHEWLPIPGPRGERDCQLRGFRLYGCHSRNSCLPSLHGLLRLPRFVAGNNVHRCRQWVAPHINGRSAPPVRVYGPNIRNAGVYSGTMAPPTITVPDERFAVPLRGKAVPVHNRHFEQTRRSRLIPISITTQPAATTQCMRYRAPALL